MSFNSQPMKTLIAIIVLISSVIAGQAQTRFAVMTNLPARMETLSTSNFVSVGTFKADSELALWVTCWGTNANANGNLSTVWYMTPDGTNYGTEPITFNFTPGGVATNTFRTNFPIELSRMAWKFKLATATNASASTVWFTIRYSRAY
jgi:hypothetical protein